MQVTKTVFVTSKKVMSKLPVFSSVTHYPPLVHFPAADSFKKQNQNQSEPAYFLLSSASNVPHYLMSLPSLLVMVSSFAGGIMGPVSAQ